MKAFQNKFAAGSRGRSGSSDSADSSRSRHSSHGEGWFTTGEDDETQILMDLLGVKSPEEEIRTKDLVKMLEDVGIMSDDPRVKEPMEVLLGPSDTIKGSEFIALLEHHDVLERALKRKLTIPDFQGFCREVDKIYHDTEGFTGGKNADYIPQLSEAYVDPNQYGVAICTVTGQRYAVGESKSIFCIQSCSKPITYALAMNEQGSEKTHKHVGKEPSGRRFNETILDRLNRPHNPCINAGAIMSCSLVKPGVSMSDRFDHIVNCWTALAGDRRPGFANSTYLSESSTADRNYCLAFMMKEKRAFPEWIDTAARMTSVLEFYFMCCSLEFDAEAMAIVAATLANGGVNPLTQKRVLDAVTVRNTLSIMGSCGMYDYSGEFAFRIGLPAKSGVGGCILVVVPGVMGIATFSPRLAADGNSVRGVEFCKQLERRFTFHAFDNVAVSEKIDPCVKEEPSKLENLNIMLYAAADGDLTCVRRMLARGVCINAVDADGRSALHVAASEGRMDVVTFLVEHGADLSLPDRYGGTALLDAEREGRDDVAAYLKTATQREAHDSDNSCRAAFIALDTGSTNTVFAKDLLTFMIDSGFRKDDPRVQNSLGDLDNLPDEFTFEEFSKIFCGFPKLKQCISGNLTIPDFQWFGKGVQKVFEKVRANRSGQNADYIEPLKEMDPELQGLGICTVDGQRLSVGDAKTPVTAQAISNVITYLLAVKLCGDEKVHSMVGFEPSGGKPNALALDYSNRPHNPFINSGGIMCAAMIKPRETLDARFDAISHYWQELQGGEKPGFNNYVYLSEMDCDDRDMCIAYHMRDSGCFSDDMVTDSDDLENIIRLYYQACSVEVTCDSLAVVAATLANGGVCPLTRKRLIKPSTVRNCLSLMFHCGMADYAGEFGFEIGFPAKNSASGIIMAVIPGVMGAVFFSPRLDHARGGSSARGVDFFSELGLIYRIHQYTNLHGAQRSETSVDPCEQFKDETNTAVFEATHAAARGDVERLKALHATGVDLGRGDYDGRTPLHLAASGNSLSSVKLLLRLPINVNACDRWGKTPYDDAVIEELHDIAALLASHGGHPGDTLREMARRAQQ